MYISSSRDRKFGQGAKVLADLPDAGLDADLLDAAPDLFLIVFRAVSLILISSVAFLVHVKPSDLASLHPVNGSSPSLT